jgi:hypothetical protein
MSITYIPFFLGIVDHVSHVFLIFIYFEHSMCWGRDQDEVSFKDITNSNGSKKSGYEKLIFYRKQAKMDGLHFF